VKVIKGIEGIRAALTTPPVSRSTVFNLINDGKLKVFKLQATTCTSVEFIDEYHQSLLEEAGIK